MPTPAWCVTPIGVLKTARRQLRTPYTITMQTVPVVVTAPLDGPFDYQFDQERPEPGRFVLVPFGSREIVGVVWDYGADRQVDAKRIKSLIAVLDAPLMPEAVRRMIDHARTETLNPRGAILKLAIPVPQALDPAPRKPGFRLKAACDADTMSETNTMEAGTPGIANPRNTLVKLGKPETRALDLLAGGTALLQSEITKKAGISAAKLRKLDEAGLIEQVWIEDRLPLDPPDVDAPGPELSADQARAARSLCDAVHQGYSATLLEGVPGAGKTEVYLEAVVEALKAGRNVMVLLPEIALSAPWIQRFERRFGVRPVVWHSGLTAKQRVLAWQAIARGDVRLVVGARSTLFLPITNLGLIVVDEEHDSSFKQEEGAIYHARDLAEARARIENCPIVLASATPSIETALRSPDFADDVDGIEPVTHLFLPGRFGGAAMPVIETVDLRKDRPAHQRFLSSTVIRHLRETFHAGRQSLIFLNRRGYAPLTLCRACGHRMQCPSCSAWLVSHRFRRRLICHHCGYGVDQPEFCPGCGSIDSLVASGPGVERLADEIKEILPEARTDLLTSDQPRSADVPALLERMVEGEIDVLIGTQIIAKGHHFPRLTNVVVADADLGLAGGDLRAAERSFQLLYQVSGRAGREKVDGESVRGKVLIQTHLPDHPVIQALAAGDKDRFYEVEMSERQAMNMPPFGRLGALIISGPDHGQVRDHARKIARLAPEDERLMVLGPAPAPLSLLRGRYRERILIKAERSLDLPASLRAWLSGVRLPSKVYLAIDIDPISFL